MNTIIQQPQFSLSTLKPNQILFLEWIYTEQLKQFKATSAAIRIHESKQTTTPNNNETAI